MTAHLSIVPVQVPPSTELRQVLAELELLSHGTTQGWNKSGRSSERDTRPQGGDTSPPHEAFRRDWDRARSDDERRQVLREAREHLQQWRVAGAAKPAKVVRTQVDIDREMAGYAGWTPREVAKRTGGVVPEGQLMQWRRGRGLDPSTGYEIRTEDPTVQARRLKDQGLSMRDIARYQGVDPSTVSRRLRDAA